MGGWVARDERRKRKEEGGPFFKDERRKKRGPKGDNGPESLTPRGGVLGSGEGGGLVSIPQSRTFVINPRAKKSPPLLYRIMATMATYAIRPWKEGKEGEGT